MFPILYVLFRAGLYQAFQRLALSHPEPAVHQLGVFVEHYEQLQYDQGPDF